MNNKEQKQQFFSKMLKRIIKINALASQVVIHKNKFICKMAVIASQNKMMILILSISNKYKQSNKKMKLQN